jgi:hypothetical protein
LTENALLEVSLYDVKGSLVQVVTYPSGNEGTTGDIQGEWNTIVLNLEAIKSGVYFLQVSAQAEVRHVSYIEKIAIVK